MAVLRDHPYGNYNFLVDLGGGDTSSPQAAFAEVVFPELSFEVMEYRSGNSRENLPRKLTGVEHSTNLVLRRGVIGALDLYQWYDQVRDGNVTAFRTVLVMLQNEDRTQVVMTWRFLRARPAAYTIDPLVAGDSEILLKTLELAFEKMEME